MRRNLLFSLGFLAVACGTEEPNQPVCPGDPGCPPVVVAPECSADKPCGNDLVCSEDGKCVVPPCTPGTLGCACTGGCGEGLECGSDDTCQVIDCPEGTVGCGCFADSTCTPSETAGEHVLCHRGTRTCRVVVDDSPIGGEPSLACTTPCSQSITLPDGTFRYCSPEGLMEGCIAGLECVQGTCVAPGGEVPVCGSDAACPDFQKCIDGRCLSNCEANDDCAGGAICRRKVCRTACTLGSATCPPGFGCEAGDGEDGVCVLLGAQPGPVTTPPLQRFELSTSSLVFDPNQTQGAFTIRNPTALPLRFNVRKAEHRSYGDSGLVVVTEQPLFWLKMGTAGNVTQVQELNVDVPAGGSVAIAVSGAQNETLRRWEGRLEVFNDRLGTRSLALEYSSRPDGEWSGSIYYFINFDDTKLDAWLAAKDGAAAAARAAAEATKNALLVQWTRFRKEPLFRYAQWDALVQATVTGSWAYANVRDACDGLFTGPNNAECFLYDSGQPDDPGVSVYTDAADIRIPSDVLEMPFSVRFTKDAASSDPLAYTGRIETANTLQYPGNPAISLAFKADPTSCEQRGTQTCLVPLRSFTATSSVAGRRLLQSGGSCGALARQTVPWLVPGFLAGTQQGANGPERTECRENTFPLDPATSGLAAEINASLAEANPIPDGRRRVRTLSLVDGVMINQNRMFAIVREQFSSNLGASGTSADFSAYGIALLQRAPTELAAEDYQPGLTPPAEPAAGAAGLDVSCRPQLVSDALAAVGRSGLAGNENVLARVLLDGSATQGTLATAPEGSVHYLCHTTGRFDGGLSAWSAEGGEDCPYDSGVTYFLYSGAIDLRNHACQGSSRCTATSCPKEKQGTCAETLGFLRQSGQVTLDPSWTCADDAGTPAHDTINCSQQRNDLRANKVFYTPSASGISIEPLRTAIDEAFRYKTRFRNRTGASVGFVPTVCALDGDALPYCYDPVAIEETRDRVDCLLSLYAGTALDTPTRTSVRAFLKDDFAVFGQGPGGLPYDGFERLYAELLVMLGDDAFTLSLGSRFDLAGSAVGTFDGDLLEPDGIQLAGGAGYEMKLLYRSMQYYQLAQDRFNRLGHLLWRGLDDTNFNFVTLDTISTYFNRLILASTKKARAASEISRHYLSFNRPDLARRVVERAYTQAYLESMTVSQFMRRSIAVLQSSQVAALQRELGNAQTRYRVALQQMREAYQAITDDLTFFGDAPEYIPFPALNAFSSSGVEVMLERAFETMRVAREREDRALSSNRQFDSDAQQFQAELRRVQNQFESDLAEVCGTFTAPNGHAYPAIPRYAALSPIATVVGNPCGLMGNGEVFQAVGEIDLASADLRSAIAGIRAVYEQVDIEKARANAECAGRVDIATLQFQSEGRAITLESEIRTLNQQIGEWEKKIGVLDRSSQVASSAAQVLGEAAQVGDTLNVTGFLHGAAAAGYAVSTGFTTAALVNQIAANDDIRAKEREIANKESAAANVRRTAQHEAALRECCLDPSPAAGSCQHPGPLMVNSNAQVDNLMAGLKQAEIAALRADLGVRLAVGRLAAVRARADRLMAQQEEQEQLLIDVEAARNDPNTRIYKNSEVLDADRSFNDLRVDAYRATRVFEYYTGQSYPNKDELFLARLVGRGDFSVENYLLDLQRAFREFESTYGRPSTRLAIVSLRDDIFRIPLLDEDGGSLTSNRRIEEFRRRLTDTALLDARGYVTVPFNTSLEQTSPLTAIHKIAYIQADIAGTGTGDRIGRLYLTARGTGTVRSLTGRQIYHRFSPVTAVINPFFNSVQAPGLDPEIYKDERLRDRPFVNSNWELGFNQRDELVNRDINLNSLTDIKIYFYYVDFTQL